MAPAGTCPRPVDPSGGAEGGQPRSSTLSWADPNSPLEEEEVEVVVFLGEEVAKDAGGVATADLVGG